MKRYLFFILCLFISNFLSAQNMSYTVMEFKAKENTYDKVVDMFIENYKDVEFKPNCGINLDGMGFSKPRGMNFRIVRFHEVGHVGSIFANDDQLKEQLFWGRLNELIEEMGTISMGRMLSWLPGDFEKNKAVHFYSIIPEDPVKFKSAHDKFLNSVGNYFDGKTVGYGTIDVNSADGATHWVALSTNYEDGGFIQLHHDLENKFGKQQMEWAKTNGGVEIVDEYSIHVHASFPKN